MSNPNQNQNGKVEKLTSEAALALIVATANAQGLEHQRINPDKAKELSKTFGAWNQPRIVTTPRGVIIEGADYLAALAARGGQSAEVVIDRTGRAQRRATKEPTTLVQQLTRAGIQDAAFKLAVYRAVREAHEVNPEEETKAQLVEKLSERDFAKAFESLKAPYDLIKVTGPKATRVRSKIVFAAFFLAYKANPKKIIQLYTDFLGETVADGSPLAKLLHAAKHDNINTGSGRRPFMLKAAILLQAQLAGEKVERALADEIEGSKVVELFGNA